MFELKCNMLFTLCLMFYLLLYFYCIFSLIKLFTGFLYVFCWLFVWSVKVAQSCPTLYDHMDCPWNSPGKNTGMGSLSLFQGIFPTQGLNPGSPTLQADSLPAEPQGKPKNTGVGSLSLLQGVFQTQELNWGLPHCRQILYQLSYYLGYFYTLVVDLLIYNIYP